MKRHHCTLIIHTNDDLDEKYCIPGCPMLDEKRNVCGIATRRPLDGGRDENGYWYSIRHSSCPWITKEVVEYTK
jgi:hypothetical protein